jgi:hypothetical protein
MIAPAHRRGRGRRAPIGLASAAIVLAACGDSFSSGAGTGPTGVDATTTSTIATGSTGAGGAVTSTSGAGGDATTSTGAGGATTTSTTTGAGGATTTTTSTGAGGATTTTTPPPPSACQGTPFFTLPAPTAGLPFELHMNIVKPGQGWTCIAFTFSCTNDGVAVTKDAGHLTPDGYAASWVVQGCGAGAVHARFAQHVKSNANCYCDGDPATCSYESDGQVTDGGSVEAECGFTIGG